MGSFVFERSTELFERRERYVDDIQGLESHQD